MLKAYTNNAKYRSIWTTLNTPGGYQLNDDYKLIRQYESITLVDKKNATLIRLSFGNTNYCCGVLQLGNFFELTAAARYIPDDVMDKFMKILASIARNQYNKGVLQAWFFKTPRRREFEHPIIRNWLKRLGFKPIGRITYNPNSGNQIRGYQTSIAKRGVKHA